MNKKIIGVVILAIVVAGLGWYVYIKGMNVEALNAGDQAAAVTTAVAPLQAFIFGPTAETVKIVVGSNITFTASTTGGVKPFTYAWTFSNGASASGQYGNWKVSKPLGLQPVSLAVKDATGKVVIAEKKVNVIESVSLSNLSAAYVLVDNGSSPVSTSSIRFDFNLDNNSKNDVYVSKKLSTFVATSTTAKYGRLVALGASPYTLAGDSINSYVIPALSSRRFTLEGDYGNDGGTSRSSEFKITKINYGTSPTLTAQSSIVTGLEALRVYTFLNN